MRVASDTFAKNGDMAIFVSLKTETISDALKQSLYCSFLKYSQIKTEKDYLRRTLFNGS